MLSAVAAREIVESDVRFQKALLDIEKWIREAAERGMSGCDINVTDRAKDHIIEVLREAGYDVVYNQYTAQISIRW